MSGNILINIAKEAILEEFLQRKLIDKEKLLRAYPKLSQKGAVFVTLEKNKNLRGCIGTLVAHRTLLEDLIHNAKAAAFSDTRFSPLSKVEFDDKNFSLEISLLSAPQRVQYKDHEELRKKIRPHADGVILKYGNYQATFLPQVWEQLPKFEHFFAHLCQKAGLRANCLEGNPEIYCYRVQKIKE